MQSSAFWIAEASDDECCWKTPNALWAAHLCGAPELPVSPHAATLHGSAESAAWHASKPCLATSLHCQPGDSTTQSVSTSRAGQPGWRGRRGPARRECPWLLATSAGQLLHDLDIALHAWAYQHVLRLFLYCKRASRFACLYSMHMQCVDNME